MMLLYPLISFEDGALESAFYHMLHYTAVLDTLSAILSRNVHKKCSSLISMRSLYFLIYTRDLHHNHNTTLHPVTSRRSGLFYCTLYYMCLYDLLLQRLFDRTCLLILHP